MTLTIKRYLPFSAVILTATLLAGSFGLAPAYAIAKHTTASQAMPVPMALSQILGVQNAIKSSSNLAFSATTTINDGKERQTYQVSGQVERPNKLQLTASQAGKPLIEFVCDGSTFWGYSFKSGHYIKAFVPNEGFISRDPAMGLFIKDEVGDPVLQTLLSTASMFLHDDVDLAGTLPNYPGASRKSSVTSQPSSVDGFPVTSLAQLVTFTSTTDKTKTLGISLKLIVDRATTNPRLVIFSEGPSAQKLVDVRREEYSKFAMSTTPLDPATFVFTPPATASSFPIPTTDIDGSPIPLSAGTVAPDFTVQSASGTPVKLSDYSGKVVVLDFWATWCGPCMQIMPETDALASANTSKGVVFLPVCESDTKANFDKFRLSHSALTSAFLFDPGQQTEAVSLKLYSSGALPTQFVIGKDGKIVAVFVGIDPESDPDLSDLQSAIDHAISG